MEIYDDRLILCHKCGHISWVHGIKEKCHALGGCVCVVFVPSIFKLQRSYVPSNFTHIVRIYEKANREAEARNAHPSRKQN